MRKTEKPIVRNNALRNERVLEDQRKQQVENPYESDKHKEAREYLKDKEIEVKAVIGGNDENN